MNKIIDIKSFEIKDIEVLTNIVSKFIKENKGYQPYGPIITIYPGDGYKFKFCQQVVKYEEKIDSINYLQKLVSKLIEMYINGNFLYNDKDLRVNLIENILKEVKQVE